MDTDIGSYDIDRQAYFQLTFWFYSAFNFNRDVPICEASVVGTNTLFLFDFCFAVAGKAYEYVEKMTAPARLIRATLMNSDLRICDVRMRDLRRVRNHIELGINYIRVRVDIIFYPKPGFELEVASKRGV